MSLVSASALKGNLGKVISAWDSLWQVGQKSFPKPIILARYQDERVRPVWYAECRIENLPSRLENGAKMP
jgi:hypothetical protein